MSSEALQQAAELLREALLLLSSNQGATLGVAVSRPPGRLLRLPEVQRMTGLRRSAIYDHMQRGVFPKSAKAGARITAWSEAAIQAWIAERLDSRR